MPLYDFKNTETGEYEERSVRLADYDKFLEDNPHLQRVITKAPSLNQGGVGDRTKADGGFKEVLSKISDANPTSALASDYGKKDSKSVKVRNAVQSVRKRMGEVSSKD